MNEKDLMLDELFADEKEAEKPKAKTKSKKQKADAPKEKLVNFECFAWNGDIILPETVEFSNDFKGFEHFFRPEKDIIAEREAEEERLNPKTVAAPTGDEFKYKGWKQ
jgi:hypothetical protein